MDGQVVGLAKIRGVIPISGPGLRFCRQLSLTDLKERKLWRHVDVGEDEIDVTRLSWENLVLGNVTEDAVNSGLVN